MMKEVNYSKLTEMSESVQDTLRSPKSWRWSKMYYNVGLVVLAAFAAIVLLLRKESIAESSARLMDQLMRAMAPEDEPHWDHSSSSFQPRISDWDEQREEWMRRHIASPGSGEKSKVWIATDSSPKPFLDPYTTSHVLLKTAKNKLDYSRIHGMQLYYSMNDLDPEFGDWWTKLPVVRMLMLEQPQVEWIWWMDSDAVFTDMSFVPPFDEMENYNFAFYGEEQLMYNGMERNSASTASFLIRNCQWSLDLIDAWGSMRRELGVFQSGEISNRSVNLSGDDQSGIIYLLAQDSKRTSKVWIPKVKLVAESDYALNADWRVVGQELENLTKSSGVGKDRKVNQRRPLVTHFAGCVPGSPEQALSIEPWDECFLEFNRIFDFADNQVYDQYGFAPRQLGGLDVPLIYKDTGPADRQEKEFVNGEDYYIPPKIFNWDEQRRQWKKKHPSTKPNQIVHVGGSAPKPCQHPLASHYLLRGFKNKVDYCRKHEIPFFFNMALVHKNLTGWWSKIPVLRMIMLQNPGLEWVWWMDSDAYITDMDFKYPFERFNKRGQNIVLYGDSSLIYEQKYYAGINSGNFLMRNCQWSLDLFDRWASFGATEEIRVENGKMMHEFLLRTDTPFPADDQSALVYLMVSEREKWGDHFGLEREVTMSGTWQTEAAKFEQRTPKNRPFVTHFAGCKPCSVDEDPVQHEECLRQMERTLNFADNQVMEIYGLRHENLSSSELLKVEKVDHSDENFDEKENYDQPTQKEETSYFDSVESYEEEMPGKKVESPELTATTQNGEKSKKDETKQSAPVPEKSVTSNQKETATP